MRLRAASGCLRFAHVFIPLAFFSLLLLASARGLQAPQDQTSAKTINIDDYRVIDAHRIGEPPIIRPARYTHDDWDPFESMHFQVVVDESGAIISSQLMRGDAAALSEATAQLLQLKYQPFTQNDVPVRAKFTEYVQVLPVEQPIQNHVPFPDTSDRSSVRMSLSRSNCFGTCPSYTVTISGDGSVEYNGGRFTAISGTHRSQVSYEDVSNLIEKFRAADFFSLANEYHANVTDVPIFGVCLTIDGKNKQVTDYWGERAGMPHSVTELENEIDRVSGSARWVKGTPVSSFDANGPSQ
jgi:hypothetical protein